jgi:hypothetical protein
MTDANAPVVKHLTSARAHLAGVVASRAWVQDLAAAHLLRTQTPISSKPFDKEASPPK